MNDSGEEFGTPEESIHEFYGVDGHVQLNEKKTSLAHTIGRGDRLYYFVAYYRGNVYDPHGVYANKVRSREIESKKTTKKTFDLYIKYLNTRNRSFLTLADRNYVNG